MQEEELDSPIIKELVQAGVRRIHYRRELTVLKELGSVRPSRPGFGKRMCAVDFYLT